MTIFELSVGIYLYEDGHVYDSKNNIDNNDIM